MFDGSPSNIGAYQAAYAGKSLYERATGRFYTPDHLAADLARQMIDALDSVEGKLTVCDPFCGDGQLVAALMCALAEGPSRPVMHVHLFDQEHAAVAAAQARVAALATQLGLTVLTKTRVGDSFQHASFGEFDAVITNPPWELLKPDAREMESLSPTDRATYRAWLATRCSFLDALLPEARADVSWAGWGTNLARSGWALALRSCRRDGVLGIVLPGTLMGDQASMTMRKHALTHAHLVDVAAYPPEAKLFARVDQPVVAATFRNRRPNARAMTQVRLHDAARRVRGTNAVRSVALAQDECAIPVGFGAASSDLLRSFAHLSTFGALEGERPNQIWAGRELDETRVSERLVAGLQHPFVKGRMIQRFGVVEMPSSSVGNSLAEGFASAAFQRVVWRDVARASQRRRMITATIPAGWIAGNSLHVAHFRDGNEQRLRALLAVMSSYVFEFIVRSRLTTGHMSLGAIRRAQVPTLSQQLIDTLSAATQNLDTSLRDQAELEVLVAKAYGVERDTFGAILEQFPKVLPQERETLLAPDLWTLNDR